MALPIAQLPAKILRRPVVDLTFPLTKTQRRLIQNMLATVKRANGVGLAAPQVSHNFNLALIYLKEAGIPPFVIINPRISVASKETALLEEGCLSLPGVFGEVKRPKKITMTAFDAEGESFEITDDGFLARVLQHEIDHLHNRLIIDLFKKVTQGQQLLPKYLEK